MRALAIMTKFRYTSSSLPTSIYSENSSEDSPHFSDLNKATREAIDNVKKSKIILSNFEPNILQKSKSVKEKIHIEEFPSTEEWKGPKVPNLEDNNVLLFEKENHVKSYDL